MNEIEDLMNDPHEIKCENQQIKLRKRKFTFLDEENIAAKLLLSDFLVIHLST